MKRSSWLLDRDDIVERADSSQQPNRHIDAGAGRPVVHHHRKPHGFRHRLVKVENFVLVGPDVGRRRNDHTIEARGSSMLGKLYGLPGGKGRAAREYRQPSLHLRAGGVEQRHALCRRKTRPLPRAATHKQPVHAFLMQPLQQGSQGAEIELAVFVEWGGDGREISLPVNAVYFR
jgi:hypothetical protein